MTVKGNCAKFMRWDGTDTWETIAQVYNISGIGIDREEVEDDSFLDCDGSGGLEIVQKDLGTATLENPTLELGFDPLAADTNSSNQDLLVADYHGDAEQYYCISLANSGNSGFVFHGKPKKFSVGEIARDQTVRSTWEFLITDHMSDLGFVHADDIDNFDPSA